MKLGISANPKVQVKLGLSTSLEVLVKLGISVSLEFRVKFRISAGIKVQVKAWYLRQPQGPGKSGKLVSPPGELEVR